MNNKKLEKALEWVKENSLADDRNLIDYMNDLEDIEYIVNQIEQVIDFPFGLYVRGSSDGMDYWLQAEYFSKKLQKTIIWDYDYSSSFENEKEFIEILLKTCNEIDSFEKRLSIKK